MHWMGSGCSTLQPFRILKPDNPNRDYVQNFDLENLIECPFLDAGAKQ